jgi:putative ABC transport system permease protein
MDSDPIPELYFPFEQSITGTQSVVVETSVPTNSLHKTLQEKVWSVDPTQAIWRTVNLETLIEEDTAASRFFAWLIALFAATALSLAAIGLYGVIAYSVAQRTHEIGIRMAIGADSGRILTRVLRDAGQLIAIGLALGLVLGLGLAVVFSKLLAGLLFQVSPTDPPTFIGVSVLLVLIGILASLAPALRASRLDPILALRQ